MIRLGLRLTLAGGREALGRLVLIAVAVSAGVGMLLLTLGSLHAVQAQELRSAWLTTGYTLPVGVSPTSGEPLEWRLRLDGVAGQRVARLDVAATGPRSPVPPGLARVPAAGEVVVSPAFGALLRSRPPAELADRYPGRVVATLGRAALPSPDSLVVVVGRDPRELAQEDAVQQVTRISSVVPTRCGGGCALGVGNAEGTTLLLSVVTAALVFPVLVFVGAATRLSAARREQRFAALRLVGAGPRQVVLLSTVEAAVAGAAGVLGGAALFLALRPVLAAAPLTGQSAFPSDLSLRPAQLLGVAVGVPLCAAAAAHLALRRVVLSPLGVALRVTPRPPRAWRLVPLVLGIGELAWLAYATEIGQSSDTGRQALAYLSGILLTMAGLVVAGPWLTLVGGRLVARRARTAAGLLAARRLGDDPRAGFRAVSGLVLAVFVGTCAVATLTGVLARNGSAVGGGPLARQTLVHGLLDQDGTTPPVTSLDPAAEAALAAVPGVRGIAAVHATPDRGGPVQQLVACADLARTPVLGRCPAGAAVAELVLDLGGAFVDTSTPMSSTTWPASRLTRAQLGALPVDSVVVATDGTDGAVERTRTVLGLAYPRTFPPATLAEYQHETRRQTREYTRLADVVLLASLPIAGCSLAVSLAGGLSDRRRPFALLRLAGTPLAVLRRVVLLETAVPLLAAAAVAAAAALLDAHLFLRAQLGVALQPLPAGYYGVLLVGLVLSSAVLASTLPLLRRATGPGSVRD